TKRSVPLAPHIAIPKDGQVLAAISAGVNRSLAALETVGLLPILMSMKFPPRILDVGIVLLRTVAVPKSQRRSYETKKKVFPCVSGSGPLKYPPVSFRLNFDFGKVGVSGVGRKAASAFLSWTLAAASADFFLL